MAAEAEKRVSPATQHLFADKDRIWTAEEVQAATGGEWVTPPPPGWAASGLSIYAPACQPGNMAVVRSEADESGMPARAALRLVPPPACLITTDPAPLLHSGLPLLKISEGFTAIINLGRYARDQIRGKVLGVTGSAGKTTCVAMLADALSAWGASSKSAHNANLPRGVAWNLASVPRDTPHVILEMAIGRMGVSSRMARPDIAIFTNIQPAHLGENSTVHDVALTKSAIFFGMQPGGIAILNRDMLEWETVHQAATAKGLSVLHYGSHQSSDARLIAYDALQQRVTAEVCGQPLSFSLAAGGRHMALNSLAVLAAVSALGYPLEPALARLAGFTALAGRGEQKRVTLNGIGFELIDDAYNANPGSMQAALEQLSERPCSGRRIAVLSEMKELGPESEGYHSQLAAQLNDSSIDGICLVGAIWQGCWAQLKPEKRIALLDDPQQLKPLLLAQLRPDDTVLFKGSNGTELHQIVSWIDGQPTAG